MPTQKFNAAILLAAIEGFEQQKVHIDAQIAELRAMLPGQPAVTPEAPIAKRRPMSAAARKRMSDAQRKRWAAPAPTKPKRRLSAAGKAAIVAALRKRWADKKAAPVAAKKVAIKKRAKKAPAKKAQKKTAKGGEPAAAQ